MRVIVQPNASRNEVVGPYNGAVKIKIAAPAIEGRANEELVRFLSEHLDVPAKRISLDKGTTSRVKRLKIEAGPGLALSGGDLCSIKEKLKLLP